MSTLIEFFDREAVENIVSSVRFRPERVIFIGGTDVMDAPAKGRVERFLKKHNKDTVVEFVSFDKYGFREILSVIERIADKYDDCVFDVTGGTEIPLIAIGMIAADRKLRVHQVDVKTGKVTYMMGGYDEKLNDAFSVSIEDSVELHGGKIRSSVSDKLPYPFSDGFNADLDKMWGMCGEDPNAWNVMTSYVGASCAPGAMDGTVKERFEDAQLEKLCSEGLITDLRYDSNGAHFNFKNDCVKKCLVKAGDVLELYTYRLAHKMTEFSDAKTGVVIEWDSDDKAEKTTNEIDVMLTIGVIPVLISCKNGMAKKEALYELETVSRRFGGSYAKRILITSSTGANSSAKRHFKQRASDMGITVIERPHNMKDEKFMRLLREAAEGANGQN